MHWSFADSADVRQVAPAFSGHVIDGGRQRGYDRSRAEVTAADFARFSAAGEELAPGTEEQCRNSRRRNCVTIRIPPLICSEDDLYSDSRGAAAVGVPGAMWGEQGSDQTSTLSLYRSYQLKVTLKFYTAAHRERKCAENYNKWHHIFFLTTISILVISNHNSFRVLFDEIVSVFVV